MKKRLLYSLYPVITLLILLGLWSIEANRIGTEIILPSPSVTAKEIIKSFSDKKFIQSALNSVWHMAESFTLAFLLALLVGTLAGLVKTVHRFLYVIVVILRVVPTMSVILLAIIWFKDESRPIFIAFLVSFPLLYNEVYSAVSSCDKDLVEMSLVYKVRKRDKLLYFYLPTISEKMFDGVLSVLGLNVKLVIAAEAIAQTRLTLGMLMHSAKINLETGRLFAYTIIAIIISCLLEGVLRLIRYCVKKAVKR